MTKAEPSASAQDVPGRSEMASTRPASLELLERPQLVERLREARGFHAVLLTAPAGYAKSTLLRQWDQADERPFAWLMLDVRDDRPTTLLNRITKAIESVAGNGREFVLVLDDAHVIRTKSGQTALANAIKDLPPEGQVAIASRKEPALPLGHMRAHREVFELRAADLAMTASESATLLGELGVRLSGGQIDALYELTEGWPAALYLAGLSLGERGGRAADVERFAGSDRFVADYFRDEFLGGVSVARLRFLTRSSILEILNGKICDDVLDRSGSARVLRELARSNLPVEAIDHADGEYRYHPLLRQMLRAELNRREPELEDELHRRASSWYAERERYQEAIDHAIDGGDNQRAAELIWLRAAPSLAEGDRGAVRDWLDRFSDRRIAGSAPLALATAHLYLALGDGELGLHWTELAQERFEQDAVEDLGLHGDLLILKATFAVDGIEQMRLDASLARELHPPDSPWRAMACFYAGAAHHLAGELKEAQQVLEDGARIGAATGPIAQVFCLNQLTLVHLDKDDLDNALRVVAHAREQLDRFDLGSYPVMALHYTSSALAYSREGLIERAVADDKRARERLETLGSFPAWARAQMEILLARTALNLDDAATSARLLEAAQPLVERILDSPTLWRWFEEVGLDLRRRSSGKGRDELSPAELRTLRFMPSHLPFREIAERTFVSTNTVKTQARAIYRKLGVSSRAEAVEHARNAGLLDEDSHPWTRSP